MFHRDHIVRYCGIGTLPPHQVDEIMRRADELIAFFSDPDAGMFSGSSLAKILGSQELANDFLRIWETYPQLLQDS